MIFTGLQCSWDLLCSIVRYPWYAFTSSAIYCAYRCIYFSLTKEITITALVTCINISVGICESKVHCFLLSVVLLAHLLFVTFSSVFLPSGAGAVEFIICHAEIEVAFVEEKKIVEVNNVLPGPR